MSLLEAVSSALDNAIYENGYHELMAMSLQDVANDLRYCDSYLEDKDPEAVFNCVKMYFGDE